MVTPDQIEIPEGMLEAATGLYSWEGSLARALAWLANNPKVPTPKDLIAMRQSRFNASRPMEDSDSATFYSVEWQRRMFLKREPELPQEVKDSIQRHFGPNPADWIKAVAREAYELGLKNGGSK